MTTSGARHLRPGTRVRLTGMSVAMEVVEGPNAKGEYRIAHGLVTLWAHPDRLQELQPKKVPSVVRGATLSTRRRRSIDLHGLKVAEAMELLEKAISEALLADIDELDIIHGHGTGAIREATHRRLEKLPQVKRFAMDPRNRGTTKVFF